MTKEEIELAVLWFNLGMGDRIHGTQNRRLFDDDTPWNIAGAHEAGQKLGEQLLCEKVGHEDVTYEWHNIGGGNKPYTHYKSLTCRKCDRCKIIAIASFDDFDEYDAYSKNLIKARREREKE